MSKAEIVFKEELAYIESKSTRDFVVKCFNDLAADYFWDFTASSSQTHHPDVCNQKHGLVIHTKLTVWWGRKIAESFNQKNIDVVVASLLLHDLQKFGKILDQNKKPTLARYWGTHGPMLANQMEKLYDGVNIHKEIADKIRHISACVAKHMGRWTDESLSNVWTESLKEIEKDFSSIIVELADYASSRQVDKKFKEFEDYKLPINIKKNLKKGI